MTEEQRTMEEIEWNMEIHEKINGAATEEERQKYIKEYEERCGAGSYERGELGNKIQWKIMSIYDNRSSHILTGELTSTCKMFNKVFNILDGMDREPINCNENLYKCLDKLYGAMTGAYGKLEMRELEEIMIMCIKADFAADGEHITEKDIERFKTLMAECQ